MTTKQAMIDYLNNHDTYHPMNSWNGGVVYAHNVKLYYLNLTPEQRDTMYNIIDDESLADDFYSDINWTIHEWQADNAPFEVYFNGSSDGWLIMKMKDKYDYHYDNDELNDMLKSEVKEVYDEVKSFDKLRDELEAITQSWGNNTIKEVQEEVTTTVTRKVIA